MPLHDRDVVAAECFTRFAERPRRLRLLLDACGYTGRVDTVLQAAWSRVDDHASSLRELAAAGDPCSPASYATVSSTASTGHARAN